MRTGTKIAIAGVATIMLIGGAGLAVADSDWGEDCRYGRHGGGSGAFHKGGHGGFGMMRGGPMRLFAEFDENNDQTLSRQEVDAGLDSKLAGADQSGDGTLSLEEFEALWLERMRPMMVDSFQFLDEDGDGQVSRAELGDPVGTIYARLDRNNDGAITKDEMQSRRHKRKWDDDD